MPDGPQNKSGCFGEEQNKLCKLSLYILYIPSKLSLYILYIPRTVFEKYYSIHSIFEKKEGTYRKDTTGARFCNSWFFSCDPNDTDSLVQLMHAYKSYTDEH